MRRKRKRVGTLIAVWVFAIEAAFTVEGLGHVTNVVNEESQGVGLREVGLVRV